MFGRRKPPSDPLNAEYETLNRNDRARVDAVVADAKRLGGNAKTVYGTREYYAYRHPGGGFSWGIDDPINVKRGVKS